MPTLQPSEQEVKAFVGPRCGYYLQKWREALEGEGEARGINRAALLLSGLWLPYRRMFLPTAVFFGILMLDSVVEEIVFIRVLGMPQAPEIPSLIVGLIAAIVCGAYGNKWYLSHARKVIADTRSRRLPEDEHLRVLARRGGTSVLASVCSLVLLIVVTTIALCMLRWIFSWTW